jgi:hypothetical protein
MSPNRIDEGIQLCEEILKDIESPKLNCSGVYLKTFRLATLLNKKEELSKTLRVLTDLHYESSRSESGYSYEEYEEDKFIVYKSITNMWIELRFGGVIETIFEENKKLVDVDSRLIKFCPNSVEKFVSAYERLKETNPESWAQAVTTCRRILKDFADVVFPPKDTLVNGRKVGEEEYINRLWAFASEKIGSSANRELIQSEIDYIGNKIDALYSLVRKGTHGNISKHEADMSIIRTYLLIGDMIKLGDL